MGKFYLIVAAMYITMAVLYWVCYNLENDAKVSRYIRPMYVEIPAIIIMAALIIVHLALSVVPQAASIFVQTTYAAWLTLVFTTYCNFGSYEKDDRYKLVGQVTVVVGILMATSGWVSTV